MTELVGKPIVRQSGRALRPAAFFEGDEIMAEYGNTNVVNVAAGQIVPLTGRIESGKPCIQHRNGAGTITLRGLTNNQCKARYLVMYGANIAIPTGGTATEISVALTIAGEPLNSATARVTPAAVENYFNVSGAAYIDVPRGCCVNVALENTSTQAIDVANTNVIVTREA